MPTVDASTFKRMMDENPSRVYFFGINEYLMSFLIWKEPAGVIDDFSGLSDINQVPVIRSKDLPANSLVVVGVSSNYLISVYHLLEGLEDIIFCHYANLASMTDNDLLQIAQFQDSKADYLEHAANYRLVRSLLSDEESKTTWDELIRFRVEVDTSAMNRYQYRPEQQYFEPFLEFSPDECFIDAGGFDGDTALRFVKHCPVYDSIHVFEPCESTFEQAQSNLNSIESCKLYNKGLFSRSATLSFKADQGSSNTISGAGSTSIDVINLDSIPNLKPTFIKMDIEGAELEALKGASEYISHYQPKLAIAVYHKARDFWELPEFILGIHRNYKVYLRHYTEGWAETVMYFIPPSK